MRSAFCCAMLARQLFQARGASAPLAARSWLISVCCAEKLYGSTADAVAACPNENASESAVTSVSERRKKVPMTRITGFEERHLRAETAPLPSSYRALLPRNSLVSKSPSPSGGGQGGGYPRISCVAISQF